LDAADAYSSLSAQQRQIAALDQVADLLNWDQETQMPPRGIAQRAVQAGAVAAAAHALASDPRLGDWIAAAAEAELPPPAALNVAETRRRHERAVRIPAALAEELARRTAEAQSVWEAARGANDFAAFAPQLDAVIALKRAEAACLTAPGGDPYDALIDEYEPGMTADELDTLFGRLRAGLSGLRARIAGSRAIVPQIEGTFADADQLALARRLGDAFGYDWAAGRLDLAAHPSSSGTGGDVRISTRIDPADPFNCIYSTVHEVGHAVYEQGLDPEHAFQPIGGEASMGVHESQSRLFENQFGRSRPFCVWLFEAMRTAFGRTAFGPTFGSAGVASADDLYRAVNRVETGFIRTEADEVHYNLHIMLRFDLERALIAGDLAVGDLEAAWADRFMADFGRPVPDARRGVLQDVHWSSGLFGYFPTYTLGNVYAAWLHRALERDVGPLDPLLERAEIAPILDWLRTHIHRRGRQLPPRALIAAACGSDPDETALLSYLDAKFGALYDL
jgi:carboxypeptidase Taq